jgi:hypothetical protein
VSNVFAGQRAAEVRMVIMTIDATKENRNPIDRNVAILKLNRTETHPLAYSLKRLFGLVCGEEVNIQGIQFGRLCGPLPWIPNCHALFDVRIASVRRRPGGRDDFLITAVAKFKCNVTVRS